MMLRIPRIERAATGETPARWVLACLGLFLFVHLVLLGFFQVSSLDTWFHLKEGDLYVTTGSLPSQDPFAFTTEGREWVKYSWLADVLFYLVYAGGGFPGLVLLRLGVLFAIAWLLYRLLRRCNLNPVAAILLVFVASLALRFRLFIRPELLTFVLLLGTLAILLRLQTSPPWMAYTLLPLFVLWVNVHGSYVFGLGLPALVLFANLLPMDWVAPGWGRLRLDPVRRRHLALAVMVLPAAGMLNPQGVGLLLFPFRQNRMIRLTAFPEWMEAWRYPGIDPVWWEPVVILGLVLLAFSAVAWLLFAWERRLDPVGLGIVLSMGAYAIFRNRAIPYFVLAALPFLALALARLSGHLPTRLPAQSPRRLTQLGVLACLLLLTLSIVDQAFLTRRFPPGFGVARHVFPEQAAAFLERHRLDGRVFNSYQFGGYLMWRRWPANQVFIDGRYDAILFDEELLELYAAAHHAPTALDRLAEKYAFEILVLDADRASRMDHIQDNPTWARVYWDPVAEIYVRRGGHFADLVAARQYRMTRSTTDLAYLEAYRASPAAWAQAVAELQRAADDNPENVLAWQGLAQEYGAAGPTALGQRLEALTRALALLHDNPATGRLHAERAEALLQLGRPQEAEAAAREALRVDGSLLLPHWVLAGVAEGRGAWNDAREQLRMLLDRLDGSHPMLTSVRERLAGVEKQLQAHGVK
jgi:tetratricopeptide (TPR) repeat protein